MALELLLPFVAVYLGAAVALYFRPKVPFGMKLVLAFSGSFLLSIIVLDMLPHIFEDNAFNPGIWIMFGIIFQIFLYLDKDNLLFHPNKKISIILKKCIRLY